MKTRRIAENIIIYSTFAFYTLLLMKIFFMSRVPFGELVDIERAIERPVNLIPLRGIAEYLFSKDELVKQFAFGNVAGNIIVFAPMGLFVQTLRKNEKMPANVLLIVLLSVLVEAVQWAFGIGAADIDDVILNVIGGTIGIWGCRLLTLLLKKDEEKTHTAVAVVSLLGLPVIINLLFFTIMRL